MDKRRSKKEELSRQVSTEPSFHDRVQDARAQARLLRKAIYRQRKEQRELTILLARIERLQSKLQVEFMNLTIAQDPGSFPGLF